MQIRLVRSFAVGGRLILLLSLLVITLLLFSCSKKTDPIKVDLSRRQAVDTLAKTSGKTPLTFGIGSMITPKEGFIYYRQLLDYLRNKLDEPIKVVDRGTYAQINQMLHQKKLDAAFVCGGPYVEGKEAFGLDLLVMPEVAGAPVYYSYLIVPVDSPAQSLEDLRGKSFAFTDPKSNSGMIVPLFWLAKIHETPDSFFAKYQQTYAHDLSIRAVANKLVDGAAVDSLIWEFLNKTNPELTARTRIIRRSKPFGIPPIVVRPDLPATQRARLKNALLEMDKDPAGRTILQKMMIQRFIPGDDRAYDSIRDMRSFVQQHEKG